MFLFCVVFTFFSLVQSNDVPQILPFLSQFNVGLGKTFKIPCALVMGTEPVDFQWLKNGFEIEPNSRIFWESKSSNSFLVFKIIQQNDSGNYSCRAQNLFGSDSQSTFLRVQGK